MKKEYENWFIRKFLNAKNGGMTSIPLRNGNVFMTFWPTDSNSNSTTGYWQAIPCGYMNNNLHIAICDYEFINPLSTPKRK